MNKAISGLPPVIKSVQTMRVGQPDPGKLQLYEVDWGLIRESQYTSEHVLGVIPIGDAVTDLPLQAHVSKSGKTAKLRYGAGLPATPSLDDSTPTKIQAAAFRLRKVAPVGSKKITAADVIRVWRRIE